MNSRESWKQTYSEWIKKVKSHILSKNSWRKANKFAFLSDWRKLWNKEWSNHTHFTILWLGPELDDDFETAVRMVEVF